MHDSLTPIPRLQTYVCKLPVRGNEPLQCLGTITPHCLHLILHVALHICSYPCLSLVPRPYQPHRGSLSVLCDSESYGGPGVHSNVETLTEFANCIELDLLWKWLALTIMSQGFFLFFILFFYFFYFFFIYPSLCQDVQDIGAWQIARG